jgi:predicted Zn finger-like uncharacterized protein
MIKLLYTNFTCPECNTKIYLHSQKEMFRVIKTDIVKCNKCNTEFSALCPEYIRGTNPHEE